MSEQTPTPNSGGRRRALSLGLIAALVVATAFVIAMGWHRQLSLEALVRHRTDLDVLIRDHYALALGAFVGIYTLAVALSAPGAVFLTVAGGALFGWTVGGTAAVVGASAGATVVFLLARTALADLVARSIGERAARLADGFRADAFNYLLFLRLVPLFPFWFVNLAPALFDVRLSTYVAATVIGIVPAAFAFAAFGAGLDSAIGAQETAYKACVVMGRGDCRIDFNVSAALTPQLLAALVALGCVALIPVAVRHWRRGQKSAS